MAKYGKWIGGGLGWAFGGPIGAIVGFALGAMIDESTGVVPMEEAQQRQRFRTRGGDFTMSLLVLTAAVMRADGTVKKAELEYVKQFFVKQFGVAYTREQMKVLRDIMKKEIPLYEVCEQIRQNMAYPMRLQLLHYLFGISRADGKVDQSEIGVIQQIAGYLGISDKDFESIRAMFHKDTGSAYKILEIDRDASDDEVKKAYRKMAVKYHPDKVSHLGEKFQKAAKDKFQKVQNAYEQIKKERDMA